MVARVLFSVLRSKKLIHRLLLRYGVAVWSTANLDDTATTLNLLAAQVQEDPKVFEGEQLSYTDVQHTTKKANKDDPRAFAIAALQGCPVFQQRLRLQFGLLLELGQRFLRLKRKPLPN